MEPVGSLERLLAQPWQGVFQLHRGRGAGGGVVRAARPPIRLLSVPSCVQEMETVKHRDGHGNLTRHICLDWKKG